jgi:hypothetical protein
MLHVETMPELFAQHVLFVSVKLCSSMNCSVLCLKGGAISLVPVIYLSFLNLFHNLHSTVKLQITALRLKSLLYAYHCS